MPSNAFVPNVTDSRDKAVAMVGLCFVAVVYGAEAGAHLAHALPLSGSPACGSELGVYFTVSDRHMLRTACLSTRNMWSLHQRLYVCAVDYPSR